MRTREEALAMFDEYWNEGLEFVLDMTLAEIHELPDVALFQILDEIEEAEDNE